MKTEEFMDDCDIESDFMQVMEEDELVQRMIQELSKNKMVPVFSEPLERHKYLGCGKVIAGPEHIHDIAGEKIGFCKIRMYDDNEVAGHWIDLKLLKVEEYETIRSA